MKIKQEFYIKEMMVDLGFIKYRKLYDSSIRRDCRV
jgi:hypothetical protein